MKDMSQAAEALRRALDCKRLSCEDAVASSAYAARRVLVAVLGLFAVICLLAVLALVL